MSVTITRAEQKFIYFLDGIRGTKKQCHVDNQCQEEVNKLYKTIDKSQELKLTVDSKEVVYAGNFQNSEPNVSEAVQNTVKNSPFYDFAIKPEYKLIGVVIKAFKTGRIFFACVIRRDHNDESKPQPQQNANPNQKKGKNHNKFSAYKASNESQKPSIERYEDGRPKERSIENLCVYLINDFLEKNGKESLRYHQRAYNIMSKYHQEAYANMKPLSRSNLL
ncbi:hypothetical protein TVAGG3_0899330, partial [Trichomonas vaginalis G3]|uniref:hypothetical protein n=1 Tax=Trichomonas vaginalis (strain ATCC PRA-98 / G3) TaxID=412133 RepID=UPI0021E5B9B7